jgi:nucleoside-diphosphate-sugar epimerase
MNYIKRRYELTKIFLTGGEGFIGRNFVKLYKDVYDFDLCNSDSDQWSDASDLSEYDFVIHLGALAGVRRSHEIPEEYWKKNVEGSRKVFKACDKFERTVPVIYASSSSIYEWWLSPYATTKKAVEAIAPRMSLGLRFHTVYGDDSRKDMLYDKLVNRDASLSYLTEHTRDYTHVEDVCSAIKICMENFSELKWQKAIDVGNGTPVSVQQVADKVWPDNNLPIKQVTGEREHTCADPSVLKQYGWEPKHSILL